MFDRAHYYLTFGGNLCTASEIWQTGYRLCAFDEVHTADELLDAMESISVLDILQDCQEVISTASPAYNGQANWPSTTSVTWAKLAVIGTNGHYAGDPKIAEGAPVVGAGGSSTPAPQLAAVVSLWSGGGFGSANRGRMYWPLPASGWSTPDGATGQVPSALAVQLRQSVNIWMHATAGEVATLGINAKPAILSSKGAGAAKQVTQLGVGRVADTHRSRRNNLDDTALWATY